jgi:hypothetical protein
LEILKKLSVRLPATLASKFVTDRLIVPGSAFKWYRNL